MNTTYLISILIFGSLLITSCTSSSSNSFEPVEIEYLQYVSHESILQKEVDEQLVDKKNMTANYAIMIPESMPINEVYIQIDSVMCSLYSDNLKSYNLASYAFFRRTSITNNDNLGKSARQFSDHSQTTDMLVSYEWDHGTFRARHEHYKGSIFPVETTWNKWSYNCNKLR